MLGVGTQTWNLKGPAVMGDGSETLRHINQIHHIVNYITRVKIAYKSHINLINRI